MAWVDKQTGASKRTGYFYEGKEIALTGRKGFSGKRITHQRKWYPERVKVECAALWAVTRNFEQTAQLTTVSVYQLKLWAKEAWWTQVVNNVKKEQNDVLDAKITEVLDSAINLIKDRIDGGEYLLDRKATEAKGEPVYHRIPVRTKDATWAVDTLFNKRQLIRGEVTSRTETSSEADKLKKLQENFERLAQSKGINSDGEVIEGDSQEERLPGEIGEGEEFEQTGLEQEGSEETLSPGGILQTQG